MARDRFQGQDVLEVTKRLGAAVERARSGGGPTLIEIITYRFRGHSMSDPGKYRTSEEVEEHKRTGDPCQIARDHLIKLGVAEAELASVEASVEAEVADAVRFADESAPATVDSMHRFVHADPTLVEGGA
jgi:pyruvate dehydrogenase E1 component alpha subunit